MSLGTAALVPASASGLRRFSGGFEYTGENEEAETALSKSLKVRGGDELDYEHTDSHSSMAFVKHEGQVPAAA